MFSSSSLYLCTSVSDPHGVVLSARITSSSIPLHHKTKIKKKKYIKNSNLKNNKLITKCSLRTNIDLMVYGPEFDPNPNSWWRHTVLFFGWIASLN
ncbi:hypothetical protein Hanom_Chr14g01334301 [Helianthus anomalus]